MHMHEATTENEPRGNRRHTFDAYATTRHNCLFRTPRFQESQDMFGPAGTVRNVPSPRIDSKMGIQRNGNRTENVWKPPLNDGVTSELRTVLYTTYARAIWGSLMLGCCNMMVVMLRRFPTNKSSKPHL